MLRELMDIIGVLLAPMLKRKRHKVIGLDTGCYRDGWLYSDRELMGQSDFILTLRKHEQKRCSRCQVLSECKSDSILLCQC